MSLARSACRVVPPNLRAQNDKSVSRGLFSDDCCRAAGSKQAYGNVAPQGRSRDARLAGSRSRRGPRPRQNARPLQAADQADFAKAGENLLLQMELDEQYLGFAMVAITNEFWRDQVSAIDFKRRLLLLPHCLKNAEGCPADYDEFGLDCRKCGACSVADFKTKAEDLGYKVLVSRRDAHRPQDHRQRPRRCHRRRGLPERAGKGDRQDPAGRHSLRGGAAAFEQLPEHVGR